MRISIIGFTQVAVSLALRLSEALQDIAEVCVYAKNDQQGCRLIHGTLKEWCKEQFTSADAIIFVSATGIAIRTIAPFIEDKFKDPAVLVLDEKGKYIIPLLSGHVGGANKLAITIGEKIAVTPVITTATDLSDLFAVDVFATDNHLAITDAKRGKLKDISATLLQGKYIDFYVDETISVLGNMPKELHRITKQELQKRLNESNIECINQANEREEVTKTIAITQTSLPDRNWLLNLHPICNILGVGCKKDTDPVHMENMLQRFLTKYNLSMESFAAIASIDIKKEEPAILNLAEKLQLPFMIFSAEQLMQIPGAFTASTFVQKTTGADNVCERAAMAAACELWKEGYIQINKEAYEGITFSMATKKTVRLQF